MSAAGFDRVDVLELSLSHCIFGFRKMADQLERLEGLLWARLDFERRVVAQAATEYALSCLMGQDANIPLDAIFQGPKGGLAESTRAAITGASKHISGCLVWEPDRESGSDDRW